MNKELLELNKDTLCKLSELDKSKVYLFELEVGDSDKDAIFNKLRSFRAILKDIGVEGILSTMQNGIGEFKITELKKYAKAEEE